MLTLWFILFIFEYNIYMKFDTLLTSSSNII
jgi:hypothetical protein